MERFAYIVNLFFFFSTVSGGPDCAI